MSKENKEAKESQERDIRLPEEADSKEEQRKKSVKNTEKRYEAESPADPYQDPPEEIQDRAQDNIDYAENDMNEEDLP
ncbi:hypothetical protein [Albibacterium bauzanense]|uniref:Uncharacterized protein n=1 Tax=Albibacterium bauzanense TaxID=653929 RepID=A0A4R1LYC0_9SPHI|nr:hypothetical protein [Albibacterium bauzanense]TCK83590.1 hypothetical protein C8N28_2192 [Albibacterium bauzanense]